MKGHSGYFCFEKLYPNFIDEDILHGDRNMHMEIGSIPKCSH